MHNKPFEKQNLINSTTTKESIKNRSLGGTTVTNFSLQNKGT